MGVGKHTFDEKVEIIKKFLKENEGHSQGELARALMTDLGYESEMSARVSIGKILEQMQELKIAYFKEQRPKRGFIPMKVWYLEEDGFHKVSGEE